MARSMIVFLLAAFFTALTFAAPTTDEDQVLEIPPECIGQRYCSVRPAGYEQLEDKMNSILPEVLVKKYADRNGEASIKTVSLSPEEDWHNCPRETKLETWYAYYRGPNNTESEYFVQTDVFKQEVETVDCANDHIEASSDVQCFQDLVGIAGFQMQSKCVTSYAMRTFYVFDLKRNLILQKPFPVPSYCQCRVRVKDEDE